MDRQIPTFTKDTVERYDGVQAKATEQGAVNLELNTVLSLVLCSAPIICDLIPSLAGGCP